MFLSLLRETFYTSRMTSWTPLSSKLDHFDRNVDSALALDSENVDVVAIWKVPSDVLLGHLITTSFRP